MPLTPVTLISLETASAAEQAAQYISQQLIQYLHQPTLLLLSGGSAIAMYKTCFTLLYQHNQQFANLIVSLVDERYLPKGHPDSNETQLSEAGVLQVIESIGGTFLPYLTDQQRSGETLADNMSQLFSGLISQGTKIMMLAGIGEDGHTAGIIPTQDPNIIEHILYSENTVEYYQLPDDATNPFRFRLTTTPLFFSQVDHIIAYSTGEKKKTALTAFVTAQDPTVTLPSSYLRTSKNPVILLTDIDLSEQ